MNAISNGGTIGMGAKPQQQLPFHSTVTTQEAPKLSASNIHWRYR